MTVTTPSWPLGSAHVYCTSLIGSPVAPVAEAPIAGLAGSAASNAVFSDPLPIEPESALGCAAQGPPAVLIIVKVSGTKPVFAPLLFGSTMTGVTPSA